MRRALLPLCAVLTLLLATALHGLPQPVAPAASGCFRTSPLRMPWYAVSAAWTKAGHLLVVVEPSRNSLLFYSDLGRYLGELPKPLQALLGNFFPSTIADHEDHLILEMANRRFVRFDETLRPIRTSAGLVQKLEPHHSLTHQTIRSMALWTLAGNDFLACSDILTGTDQWTSGVVRIPWDTPDRFQVLMQSSANDPTWLYCRLGLSYFTSIGSDAYAFLMTNRPGVYRSRRGSSILERLPQFPQDYAPERPDLPDFNSVTSFAHTLAQTETTKMITGLWGWEGNLYALYREPAGELGTNWTLLRLDPADGSLLGTTLLPTHSPHLLLVPGPSNWVLLEKRQPVALGNQPTDSFLFIPARLLRGPLPRSICPDLDTDR